MALNAPTLRWLERAVIAVAIAVRGAAWWSIEQTSHARWPLVDAYTYWSQAKKMAAGEVAFPEGFYQPPGYPVLLSWIQQLSGTDATWVPRLLQLGLGVLTTVLILRIGRRVGQRMDIPWLGVVAAALYTLYPSTLLFELDLLTPAVTAVMVVGAMDLLRSPWSGWRCLWAGLLLGIGASVHPTLLVAAVAVVGWLWLAERTRMRPALAAGIGLAFGLMPITTANVTQFKRLSATSFNAGINFYMGNNPDWRETSFLPPGLRFRKLALEAEPHKRDGPARDAYWMDRAWSEIGKYPVTWLNTLGTKAIWSVNNTEIPRNEDYRCRTRAGPMTWLSSSLIGYGIVFPLAVLGAVRLWRRKEEEGVWPVLWLVLHLPVIAFIVSDRYRLSTWPLMCLCAGVGLDTLLTRFRSKARPSLWWFAWLGVCALPWLPIDSRTEMRPGWCAHVEANLAFMEGDKAKAEQLYRESIALDPLNLSGQNWLARTLSARGEIDAAIVHVDAILAAFPDHFPTLKFMAGLQRKRGDGAAAAEMLRRAYRVPGDRTHTGVQLVRLLVKLNKVDEARALMAENDRLAGHPKLKGVVPR